MSSISGKADSKKTIQSEMKFYDKSYISSFSTNNTNSEIEEVFMRQSSFKYKDFLKQNQIELKSVDQVEEKSNPSTYFKKSKFNENFEDTILDSSHHKIQLGRTEGNAFLCLRLLSLISFHPEFVDFQQKTSCDRHKHFSIIKKTLENECHLKIELQTSYKGRSKVMKMLICKYFEFHSLESYKFKFEKVGNQKSSLWKIEVFPSISKIATMVENPEKNQVSKERVAIFELYQYFDAVLIDCFASQLRKSIEQSSERVNQKKIKEQGKVHQRMNLLQTQFQEKEHEFYKSYKSRRQKDNHYAIKSTKMVNLNEINITIENQAANKAFQEVEAEKKRIKEEICEFLQKYHISDRDCRVKVKGVESLRGGGKVVLRRIFGLILTGCRKVIEWVKQMMDYILNGRVMVNILETKKSLDNKRLFYEFQTESSRKRKINKSAIELQLREEVLKMEDIKNPQFKIEIYDSKDYLKWKFVFTISLEQGYDSQLHDNTLQEVARKIEQKIYLAPKKQNCIFGFLS